MKSALSLVSAALLGGAALFSPPLSWGGSCCGGGSATALTVPKNALAVADLSFDSELYNGFWNRDGRHIPDPAGSDLKQYRLNLGGGYRFARDWQASLSLPIVWNDNRYSGTSSQTSGLGDATASLLYELLDDTAAWKIRDAADLVPGVTLGLSLVIPTGISPYDDLKSSFDVTGRGFYRLDGTLLVEKTVHPWNASLALAYGSYLERPVNREYGKAVTPYRKQLGDRMSASASLGYSYVIGTGGDMLIGAVSYAWLEEQDTSYSGVADVDSGFSKQSLGGTVTYSCTDRDWSIRGGWSHAIREHGWGRNFPTTDVFTVGVRYVFR